jgi:hypothetical protein
MEIHRAESSGLRPPGIHRPGRSLVAESPRHRLLPKTQAARRRGLVSPSQRQVDAESEPRAPTQDEHTPTGPPRRGPTMTTELDSPTSGPPIRACDLRRWGGVWTFPTVTPGQARPGTACQYLRHDGPTAPTAPEPRRRTTSITGRGVPHTGVGKPTGRCEPSMSAWPSPWCGRGAPGLRRTSVIPDSADLFSSGYRHGRRCTPGIHPCAMLDPIADYTNGIIIRTGGFPHRRIP